MKHIYLFMIQFMLDVPKIDLTQPISRKANRRLELITPYAAQQLFTFDGRQVSDRPENLVGPPALGYLVSWRRSWVVVRKFGGLRDGTIQHDKSS